MKPSHIMKTSLEYDPMNEVGSGEGSHNTNVEDHYLHQYYEALDIAIFRITDRFDQPGHVMYKNLESLLVSAANGQVCDQYSIM